MSERLDRIEKFLENSQKESEKYRLESEKEYKELRELQKKNEINSEKEYKKLRELLGYEKQSKGEMLEQSFFYSLREHLFLDNVKYDSIELNKDILYFKDNQIKSKEFDILLLNGKTLAVIEIKSKPKKSDIYNLLRAKEVFTQFKEVKLYIGFSNLDKKKEKKAELINLAKKHNTKLLISKGNIIEILKGT